MGENGGNRTPNPDKAVPSASTMCRAIDLRPDPLSSITTFRLFLFSTQSAGGSEVAKLRISCARRVLRAQPSSGLETSTISPFRNTLTDALFLIRNCVITCRLIKDIPANSGRAVQQQC
ncbi:hypothetical protein GJ744_001566 [Endocarpon pusillum]|uniref:Uncharacterized protein n=1 Tax=Endocarpon pusillum TaxID=364733 RepID=A0A8H7ACE8_9EURO|nr:hypothetical protein GJ744_001566 [Endocarpon pusillum]